MTSIFIIGGLAMLFYGVISVSGDLLRMWDTRRERKEWERDVRRNRH